MSDAGGARSGVATQSGAAARSVAPVTFPDRISVIDSHTEGEPTRVVIAGWPELEGRDMVERRHEVITTWDHLRSAVVCEPRGHDAVVGALLTHPVHADSDAGVVFFNNVGALGMCGHGLIGVVRTLADLGRIDAGNVRIDTPVGTVTARLEDDGAITIGNVPAYCHALDVEVTLPGLGTVTGDVAYGGNWFFITHGVGVALEPANVSELTRITRDLLAALREQGVTGADGAGIDHIELTATVAGRAASVATAAPDHEIVGESVCFVMCPGGAWDRSPCGTGTSAKLAVLHARGHIAPGQRWRQRSLTGGLFTAWLEERDGALYPFVRGRAWITGKGELRFESDDPLRAGFATS